MSPPTILRFLIVAHVALGVGSVIAHHVQNPSLLEDLHTSQRDNLESISKPSVFSVLLAKFTVAVAGIVSVLGLLVFWRPSRGLFLYATVMGYALGLFDDPTYCLVTGFESVLGSLYCMLHGVILTLIYWSPLRVLFEPVLTK